MDAGKTLAPSVSGLNLVVAAVLRDSLCVVSLLPCVADCYMSYKVCKVERFVLTIIKRRLLLLLYVLHNTRLYETVSRRSYRPVTLTFKSEGDIVLRSRSSCAGCLAGQRRMDSHVTAIVLESMTTH